MKKALKKFVLGFVSILFALTVLFLALGDNSDNNAALTEDDINTLVSNQEYKQVLSYINKNYKNSDSQELVELAIASVARSQSIESIAELNEILFKNDERKPQYVDLAILKSFSENSLTFEEPDKISDYYVKHEFGMWIN
ncbi:MAG: hypothetical protein ACOX3R_06740 [Desulfitobacteriia bacterium]